MDYLLLIIGFLLMLLGIFGSLVQALPGLPLSYLGIVLLELSSKVSFGWIFLIVWATLVIIATVLDNVIPIIGTKTFGGSKRGVWGSLIGLMAGLFVFPPIGLILGPFLGAFIGELSGGKKAATSFKAAAGSFLGLLLGTVLKVILAGMLLYYFIRAAWAGFVS
jgi:uncharacterized protein YqgC (DUF456 family)